MWPCSMLTGWPRSAGPKLPQGEAAHDLDEDLKAFRAGITELARGRGAGSNFNLVCDRVYAFASARKITAHPNYSDVAAIKRSSSPKCWPKMFAYLIYDFQIMNMYHVR
jgi:hypothetical protein